MSATRQQMPPELVLRRVRRLARPVRDLDDEVAAAEEHQPAPIRMRAIERHVEPEPRAIERRGPFGIRRRDHDMVHRRDRRRTPFDPRADAPCRARGRTAARHAWPRLRRGCASTTASRRRPHRGFRPRQPAPASASADRACDASWRCHRFESRCSPAPRPARRARRESGPRSRPRRLGAINSSVMLSSVNSTRSAPSPLFCQAGARANRSGRRAGAALMSPVRTTT